MSLEADLVQCSLSSVSHHVQLVSVLSVVHVLQESQLVQWAAAR